MAKTYVFSWVLASFLFVLLPAVTRAQSFNPTLSGAVMDPSGAPVPKVRVKLTAVATGAVAEVVSGADGAYSFPNLQPGIYALRASAPGFRDYVQTGIELAMNARAHQEVRLQLGEALQTLNVSANVALLNVEDSTRKGSIAPEILSALPLEVSGTVRTAANFATLLPGVSTAGNGDAYNARINGGQASGDEAIVDGISLQEGMLSQSGMIAIQTDLPSTPDMVGEMSILTSTYEPQYGSTTSGQIIMETKAGTNQFHGTLYEYLRNTVLNARQFGAPNRPEDIQNDFGGSLGGPVWIPHLWPKSRRTFFFINLESFRIGGGLQSPILSLPTMKERSGDFSDWVDSSGNLIPVYDPDTLRANPNFNPNQAEGAGNLPYLRNQFMGCNGGTPNVICPTDPRLQNSLAPGWFKYLPAPNLPGLLNNYIVPKPRAEALLSHTNYLDIRGDQYIGDKDHVSATIYYQGAHANLVSSLPVQISNETFTAPEYAFTDRLNWDHTLGPTLLNHFAMGYTDRQEGNGDLDQSYAKQVPQIPGVATHGWPPLIGLAPFANFGGGNGFNTANRTSRPAFIFNDLLTSIKGKHTIKIGGEYRWLAWSSHGSFPCNPAGSFSFASGETGLQGILSGSPVASFLLGQVDSGCATFNAVASFYDRSAAYIAHIGDTWKVTPKLSVNYGLRWDVYTPAAEKHNQSSFFDPLGANPGAGGRLGDLVFAGSQWGAASFGRRTPELTWYKGFSPRLGIAYSVTPKTVVRTGYGIFIAPMFYQGWVGGSKQSGFYAVPTFSSTNGGLTAAFLLNQGLPQNFVHPPNISTTFLNGSTAPSYRAFDSNRRAYAQQWNLTVEHQFTNNFSIDVAYVGNKGTRLPSNVVALNALDPKYLSMGSALNDNFGPSDTSVDGVPAPYLGWASQMTACAPSVAQALVPYPQYCGPIYSITENAGNSTYHSFQVKAEKRFSHGLWMLTSYTLEKTLTNSDSAQQVTTAWFGATGVISPFERKRDKALAMDDVPQTLSQAFAYELPVGRGRRWGANMPRVANQVVGGWSINSLLHLSSGIPLFFRSSYCNVPSQFAAACIPGVLPGVSPWAQSKSNFNPNLPLFKQNAFENDFNFQLGQGQRISNYRGFPYYNNDVGITKDIHVTEKAKFEFRAEIFNIWNWHSFNSTGSFFGQSAFDLNLGDSTFGMWNGAVTNPRSVQLSGRFSF